jgi:hypothetical protein
MAGSYNRRKQKSGTDWSNLLLGGLSLGLTAFTYFDNKNQQKSMDRQMRADMKAARESKGPRPIQGTGKPAKSIPRKKVRRRQSGGAKQQEGLLTSGYNSMGL